MIKLIDHMPNTAVCIGREGEYNVTNIEFDISELRQFGDGAVTVVFTAPNTKEEFPIASRVEDDILTIPVTASMTATEGIAQLRIHYVLSDGLKKSCAIKCVINDGGFPAGEEPDTVQEWIDEKAREIKVLEDKLQELIDKGTDVEKMKDVIAQYLIDHPIKTLTEEDVRNIIESYKFATKSELSSYAKNSDLPTDEEKSEWRGKYKKPAAGIPESDLTKEVQDKLNEAKGSVESVNGKTGKVVLNAADVHALPDTTEIPDPYDDKEIKESLSALEQTKVGYSEVVDNQLLMYSDDSKEHLLATLDLPSGGGGTKVKLNGTAIENDSDGYANIPFGATEKLGVFGTTANMGVTQYNGMLRFTLTSAENISKRASNGTSGFGAITTINYDQAVKHALCDSATGSGDELKKPLIYTEAEQASARERLGVDKTSWDWMNINVSDEDVSEGEPVKLTFTLPNKKIKSLFIDGRVLRSNFSSSTTLYMGCGGGNSVNGQVLLSYGTGTVASSVFYAKLDNIYKQNDDEDIATICTGLYVLNASYTVASPFGANATFRKCSRTFSAKGGTTLNLYLSTGFAAGTSISLGVEYYD